MKQEEASPEYKNLPPKMLNSNLNGDSEIMISSSSLTSASAAGTNNSNHNNYNNNSNSNGLSSKPQNDEILSNLLRLNNFDSISSIKDESLDIDLSACVTINTDTSGIISGNSLSSSDFWKVMDESAQIMNLEGGGISGSSNSSSNYQHFQHSHSHHVYMNGNNINNCSSNNKDQPNCTFSTSASLSPSSPPTSDSLPTLLSSSTTSVTNSCNLLNSDNKLELRENLKKSQQQQQMDFSGTFLRPEAPSLSLTGGNFSPMKRSISSKVIGSGVGSLLSSGSSLSTFSSSPSSSLATFTLSPSSSSSLNSDRPQFKEHYHHHQHLYQSPTKASLKLEGIPWLTPIRIQSIQPRILTTESKATTIHKNIDFDFSTLDNIKTEKISPTRTSNTTTSVSVSTSTTLPQFSTNSNVNNSLLNDRNSTHKLLQTPFDASLLSTAAISSITTSSSLSTTPTLLTAQSVAPASLANIKVEQILPASMTTLAAAIKASTTSTSTSTQFNNTSSNKQSSTSTSTLHTIAEMVYKCVDCDGKLFQNSDELKKHLNHCLHFKCSECDREYDLETSLKKHLKSHRGVEGSKDLWRKCPDCGKCLKLGSMWMHRKIHADNKKYGCDICGQKFVQKVNLTHHIRIHTAEKPYECSECKKRFQERSHLQRHQKYHAQTRSYRCDKCGKMYKTERCLKVHNLVHLEQRPFACTVCDKSFISNSKLKQHSNIHTGERPFKCNYCPRDFTNFPNWLKHTRRRHKVDHKTGEMLENIPSYCSKKSTRTPKDKKTQATALVSLSSSSSSSSTTTTNNQCTSATKTTNAVSTINGCGVISASLPSSTTLILSSTITQPSSSSTLNRSVIKNNHNNHCYTNNSLLEQQQNANTMRVVDFIKTEKCDEYMMTTTAARSTTTSSSSSVASAINNLNMQSLTPSSATTTAVAASSVITSNANNNFGAGRLIVTNSANPVQLSQLQLSAMATLNISKSLSIRSIPRGELIYTAVNLSKATTTPIPIIKTTTTATTGTTNKRIMKMKPTSCRQTTTTKKSAVSSMMAGTTVCITPSITTKQIEQMLQQQQQQQMQIQSPKTKQQLVKQQQQNQQQSKCLKQSLKNTKEIRNIIMPMNGLSGSGSPVTIVFNGTTMNSIVGNNNQQNHHLSINCQSIHHNNNRNHVLEIPATLAVKKTEKTKRERKQSTPKQVQKLPPQLAPPLPHPVVIKKEFIEPNTLDEAIIPTVNGGNGSPSCSTIFNQSNQQYNYNNNQNQQQQLQNPLNMINHHSQQQSKTNFSDLHCLSITSAEELIMEQALEMEECGFFKGSHTGLSGSVGDVIVPGFVDTDNAISASESMADLHFKIKQEYDLDFKLKTEENITCDTLVNKKLMNQLCSSLESSPFSSPASMEIGSTTGLITAAAAAAAASALTTATTVNNNCYLSAFMMNDGSNKEQQQQQQQQQQLMMIINNNQNNNKCNNSNNEAYSTSAITATTRGAVKPAKKLSTPSTGTFINSSSPMNIVATASGNAATVVTSAVTSTGIVRKIEPISANSPINNGFANTNMNSINCGNDATVNGSSILTDQLPSLLSGNVNVSDFIQINENNCGMETIANLANANAAETSKLHQQQSTQQQQTAINQLYLPVMLNGGGLIKSINNIQNPINSHSQSLINVQRTQQQQTLPSVDTLLFSNSSKLGVLMNGRTTVTK